MSLFFIQAQLIFRKVNGKRAAAGGKAAGSVFDVVAVGNFARTLIGIQRDIFAAGAFNVHRKAKLFGKHFDAQQIQTRSSCIEIIGLFWRVVFQILSRKEAAEDIFPVFFGDSDATVLDNNADSIFSC